MHPVRRRLRALIGATLVVATALPLAATPVAAAGSISLTTIGGAYTQDFDTLASTATSSTTPNGWAFVETGTNANTTYTAGTGSSNTGDTYSFGATSSTERALGGLLSGSLVPTVGVAFTNSTGATITSLDVSYAGEEWRLGTNTAGRPTDRLDFQYSLDATSPTTGAWTDADALDFSSPVVSGTVGFLDGNAAPNRTLVNGTITSLAIAQGATFWIRWLDFNVTGSDDGLAVDDFSITPNGVALPAISVNDVNQAEGDSGTTTFAFTVSLSAPAGAGGVTFDVATADDTATSPADYAAVSLTGQAIAAGNSETTVNVTVNGDTDPEADETFSIALSNVTGATAGDGSGTGTIANDDADSAPTVASTAPADGATSVPRTQSLIVTFSEAVNVSGAWYTITCASSGAHEATVTGGPTTFTLNPTLDFAYGEQCTLTIESTLVSDQDGNDPPDTMTIDFTVGFGTEADPCTLPFTAIPAIQGSGATVAITGTVTTQGIVVGDYEGPGPNNLRGFFIQDPAGDGNPATSDGIFVFEGSNANTVSVGDLVRVTGTAGENQGQSQVSVGTIIACGTGIVTPTDVTFPRATADDLEPYEGMLVRLPQEMTVTEHFQLGRFGQVVISQGGRLQQPTNVVEPGAPAAALQAANNLRKIILDDGSQSQNPDPIVFARGGQPLSASNTLRGGDTATNIVGVLNYTWAGNAASGNAYRIRPINALGGTAVFQAANPRPTAAPDRAGDARVVGMNLLNFFNTFDGLPDTVDNCRNGVGGAATDCRGADTQAELDRQVPKTVAAILALDADVVGVNEIENDGYGPTSSIAFLVDRLNAATAPGTWAFIDADTATGQVNALGLDAIKVGMLYRPSAVTPGGTAALNSAAFVNGGDSTARSRASLAQAFTVNATGATFVVDANHFKSKGSACDAPDAGDGQGNCNAVRVAAANELLDWLATDPTGAGTDSILLVGDYNSYAQEDPIDAIKAGGFTNLVETLLGPDAYSYVFDGQWGYLDQAFASAALTGRVAQVADVHINADEPSVLDYNTDFKTANLVSTLYAADMYRVSDHDPVLIDIAPNAAPTADAGGPYSVVEGMSVTLSATGDDANGDSLTYAWDLDGNGSFETTGQSVTFTAPAGSAPSTVSVAVQVSDTDGLTGTDTASVSITWPFDGFFSPIDADDVNLMKAGQAVPLRFTLGGDQGLGIVATGYPKVTKVTCDTTDPTDPVEETVSASSSGLRYDAVTGTYVYTWKTDRSWANSCRLFTLRLADGTDHTALFQFTK